MARNARVIHQCFDLGFAQVSRICVQIVEPAPGQAPMVEIKEFVESPTYTGWSEDNGVMFDRDCFAALIDQAETILEFLAPHDADTHRGEKTT